MPIALLPHNIRDQIAAGEVVERPASVVKEAIENALDAQATHIEITIEEGGTRLISIYDNGVGMSRKDVILSVERHATSKIRTTEDLFHLQAYGFRGEALAAIGAVSDLTITSRTHEDAQATSIRVEGGIKKTPQSASHATGTTIEVKDLFKYTPARLGYLKNIATEYRACLKEIQGFALQKPTVSFIILKDGKKTLDLPISDWATRSAQIFKSQPSPLLETTGEQEDLKIHGFIASPGNCARSRNHQFLFVNGRRIEDTKLSYAVRQAYIQSCGIEKHLHPVFSLSLQIDPIFVDVNVHPRKLEVKFAEPGQVFSAFKSSVIQALSTHSFTAAAPSAPHSPPLLTNSNLNRPAFMRTSGTFKPENPKLNFDTGSFTRQNQLRDHIPNQEPEKLVPVESPKLLRVIGQSAKKYIMAESETGLYFFDQHALHERQRFEQFWDEYKSSPLSTQDLLVPQTITLDESEVSILAEHQTQLKNLKFGFQFPADDQVRITSWPLILEGENFTQVLQDLAQYFQDEQVDENILDQIMRKCLEYKSCRGAVMFGDHLDQTEMEKLIQDFDSTSWKLLCPHGRPNHFFISFEEMDQKFHR